MYLQMQLSDARTFCENMAHHSDMQQGGDVRKDRRTRNFAAVLTVLDLLHGLVLDVTRHLTQKFSHSHHVTQLLEDANDLADELHDLHFLATLPVNIVEGRVALLERLSHLLVADVHHFLEKRKILKW